MGKYNGEYKISNHAYMELYHFCMRYDEFRNKNWKKCELIEQTALEAAGSDDCEALLDNVTQGVTYEQIMAGGVIIMSGRTNFYRKIRRKFFYLLDKKM